MATSLMLVPVTLCVCDRTPRPRDEGQASAHSRRGLEQRASLGHRADGSGQQVALSGRSRTRRG